MVELPEITRIEFGVQKEKQIRTYFGNSNIMQLEQADIDKAFLGLFEKFIMKNLKEYHDRVDAHMKNYFAGIDMSKRHWRQELIKYMGKFQELTGYLSIPANKMREYVSCIPSRSVKTHLARITKDIMQICKIVTGDGLSDMRYIEADEFETEQINLDILRYLMQPECQLLYKGEFTYKKEENE